MVDVVFCKEIVEQLAKRCSSVDGMEAQGNPNPNWRLEVPQGRLTGQRQDKVGRNRLSRLAGLATLVG